MRRVHFCVRLCREKDGRSGEVSESAEGARLLSEYTGLNLYRGFKSLPLRQQETRQLVLTNCLFSYLPADTPTADRAFYP